MASNTFDPTDHQHRRWNPMTAQWILVSPHRMKRPWSGQLEKSSEEERPDFDPTNPLCPGVKRGNGTVTPNYTSTYVFANDFPALLEDVPTPPESPGGELSLFKCEAARGTCRVMCFSPKQNLSVPLMSIPELTEVVNTWCKEMEDLGQKYAWVQVFENKGAVMGCSNPHPHCQIWASSFLPNEAEIKDKNFKDYFSKTGSQMLLDYARQELEKNERIVCQNEDWICLVPYWATWPYETMVLPKNRHILRLTDLTDQEKQSLASIMKTITTKYDNLFQTSFPYSMGFHGAPTGPHLTTDQNHWQFHALYYPPLLRSASVKKFMVGYEMLANVQRDLTAEQAAEKLKLLDGDAHYKFAA